MTEYRVIRAGESRSFPQEHVFTESASAAGVNVVIIGRYAGSALPSPDDSKGASFVAIELENESEDSSDYPADFQVHFTDSAGVGNTLRVEAVMIATGSDCDIEFGFPVPCPYLYQIESTSHHDATGLLAGRRQIVELYSQLAGRDDLDLYRPPRV